MSFNVSENMRTDLERLAQALGKYRHVYHDGSDSRTYPASYASAPAFDPASYASASAPASAFAPVRSASASAPVLTPVSHASAPVYTTNYITNNYGSSPPPVIINNVSPHEGTALGGYGSGLVHGGQRNGEGVKDEDKDKDEEKKTTTITTGQIVAGAAAVSAVTLALSQDEYVKGKWMTPIGGLIEGLKNGMSDEEYVVLDRLYREWMKNYENRTFNPFMGKVGFAGSLILVSGFMNPLVIGAGILGLGLSGGYFLGKYFGAQNDSEMDLKFEKGAYDKLCEKVDDMLSRVKSALDGPPKYNSAYPNLNLS